LVNFKIVISDKTGKSLSHELKDKDAQPFLGSKIGDSFDSSLVGLTGGKLQITGGSDKSGTPMRSDLHGGVKKYVLLHTGVGMRDSTKGKRVRKLLRGNMITEKYINKLHFRWLLFLHPQPKILLILKIINNRNLISIIK
jgi:small subunit ribosomal protein S6e